SESDRRRLAAALGLSALTSAIVEGLAEAARGYQFSEMADRDQRRSERRKALKLIARQARALEESLQTDALTHQALHSRVLVGDLALLADSAEQLAEQIPRGGGDPKLARKSFIRDLAKIFRDATGKRPTRRHDPIKGEDYGPFLDFVRAALT